MCCAVVEDHYDLTPPDLIERVSGLRRRRLEALQWTGVGARRVAAAGALLNDATGQDVPPYLAAAFAGDLLSFPGHPHRLLITVREVRAWRDEREPELAAREAEGHPFSLPSLLAERDRDLAIGPRPSWLEVYRTVYGPPDEG